MQERKKVLNVTMRHFKRGFSIKTRKKSFFKRSFSVFMDLCTNTKMVLLAKFSQFFSPQNGKLLRPKNGLKSVFFSCFNKLVSTFFIGLKI